MSSNGRKNGGSREPKALPPEALELVAARFRALAEPMRLRLLNVLMDGERSVTQLVEATGAGQANISKHLSVLREANMVTFRKEGPTTIYFIKDPMLFELCNLVCQRLKTEFDSKAAHFGS
jgi:DNA-binding transcriptional ArsR family regulator